jgi:hypothetical protein
MVAFDSHQVDGMLDHAKEERPLHRTHRSAFARASIRPTINKKTDIRLEKQGDT